MNKQTLLVGIAGFVALLTMLCFGIFIGGAVVQQRAAQEEGVQSEPIPLMVNDDTIAPIIIAPDTRVESTQSVVQPTLPAPTIVAPTVVPTSLPIASPVSRDDTNFAALERYMLAIQPLLEQASVVAERDGAIAESAENDPSVLCGGHLTANPTLVADANTMRDIHWQLSQHTAPAEAAQLIHQPLLDSAKLWAEALENINKSCTTANQIEAGVLQVGATLQFGASILNFRVAYDNFIRLALVYGIQAVTGQG